MSLPAKPVIFETLNQQKHIIDWAGQESLFPELRKPTKNIHAEYWLYSDLHDLYGELYFPSQTNWQTYAQSQIVQPAIPKNRLHTIQLTDPWPSFTNEHIVPAHEIHPDTKKQSDVAMTRYACWCATRRNPAMIFSRTYFILPTITDFTELYNTSYQFARVYLRNELATQEKNLAGVLKQLHANHQQFNHQTVQRAFFYGYSADEIKSAHRIVIKPNDPLANYMGPASLHAKACAISNTLHRFGMSRRASLEVLKIIMHEELTKERVRTIQTTGLRPEQDIHQTHILDVRNRLHQTEQEFIRKYHNIKLK